MIILFRESSFYFWKKSRNDQARGMREDNRDTIGPGTDLHPVSFGGRIESRA